jgi:hypothetical protein
MVLKLKESVLIYNHGLQKIKELVKEFFQDYQLFVGLSMKSAKPLGSVGKPKQEVLQFGITQKFGTEGY